MRYNPDLLSNHPAVLRDLSMFVPKRDMNWALITELIRGNGGPNLRKIDLLEYWEHGAAANSHKDCEACKQRGPVHAPKTPEGYVCMFIKMTYRHTERTLTNVEVNENDFKIRKALERAGAILR